MKKTKNKVKYSAGSVGSVRPMGSMLVRFLRSVTSLMSMRSGMLGGPWGQRVSWGPEGLGGQGNSGVPGVLGSGSSNDSCAFNLHPEK